MILFILLAILPPIVLPPQAWLSISRSELEPGQSYTATASTYGPGALELRGPAWLTIGPPVAVAPNTTAWRVTVAANAQPMREPEQLRLYVDGALAAEAPIRVDGYVWPAPGMRVWLPLVAR